MKLNKLSLIGDLVERLSELTDCTIPEIVLSLQGVAWGEEEANKILNYHQDKSDV